MRNSIPLVVFLAASLTAGVAQDEDGGWQHSQIRHVLLISIDGMHAVDFRNCSQGIAGVNNGMPYCPNLAALGTTGVSYVAANTSKPSDSFPGLMTIVSGATPRTMGVYYDVSYDRSLDGPAVTTGNGNQAAPCVAAPRPPATPRNTKKASTSTRRWSTAERRERASLTVQRLRSTQPRWIAIRKTDVPLSLPWNFVRTNTIFGVIHAAGGYTAWSDKHPAYSSVRGHNGPPLDDFYAPEINSSVVALPGVITPDGQSCESIPDTGADLTAWTNSFKNIKCYDTLKSNAVLNWIEGRNHLGTAKTKTPTIWG